MAAIIIFQPRAILHNALPLIAGQPFSIVVEVTDEDDIGLAQLIIVCILLQKGPVDTALIISDTALQTLLVRSLHLDVIAGIVFIFKVDIQPDAMPIEFVA